MIKFFKAEDAKVRNIAESYKIDTLLSKVSSKSLSIAVGKAENHYEVTANTASDRAYYILKGEMILNGTSCKPGDVIYIPKNTEYQFEGTFEAVIINSPAFDPQFDITKGSHPKK